LNTRFKNQDAQLKPDRPQEAVADEAEDPWLPAQKVDINFSAAFSPHCGQTIPLKSEVVDETSSSNL
jgi:hypothetical protein